MKVINNITKLLDRRRELRNKATQEEVILWSYLKNSQLGSKFRRQHSLGGYIADFYCPTRRLIIEIDGASHLAKKAVEYDKVRTEYVAGLDIRVIRFANSDIDTDIDKVLDRIKNVLIETPPCGGGVPEHGRGGD